MRKVMAIALAVVSDALRRKVLWAVLVFAALLAIAIPSLPSYGTGVDAAVFRDFAIALTFAASLVVVIALSVTRVPAEVERRTVFTILGRDVARWQYLVGTWLGHSCVMAGVELAFLAVTIGVGLAHLRRARLPPRRGLARDPAGVRYRRRILHHGHRPARRGHRGGRGARVPVRRALDRLAGDRQAARVRQRRGGFPRSASST